MNQHIIALFNAAYNRIAGHLLPKFRNLEPGIADCFVWQQKRRSIRHRRIMAAQGAKWWMAPVTALNARKRKLARNTTKKDEATAWAEPPWDESNNKKKRTGTAKQWRESRTRGFGYSVLSAPKSTSVFGNKYPPSLGTLWIMKEPGERKRNDGPTRRNSEWCERR